MPRVNISTGTPYEEEADYSRAVRIGNQVAVAGTTAFRDGVLVGINDPAEQTRIILDTIAWALEEAEASLTDVIRYRVYLTDVTHWAMIALVLAERFGEIRPANTLIGIDALVDPAMLVENDADAVVDGE